MLTLAGCATKRDIRDIDAQIAELAAQQAALLAEMQRQGMATQDTLRSTTQELFDIRGDVVRQLNTMSAQLDRIAEMVGQNSLAIQNIRDGMEQLRRSAVPTRGGGMTGGPMGATTGQEAMSNGGEAADQAYNTAMRLYQQGSMTSGAAAFADFLERFPNDELAPRAHFFYGDLLMQDGDAEGALEQWEMIGQLFPSAPVVPRAMLRMAFHWVDEGEEDNARDLLNRLINSWPDSPEAPDARDLLETLGG